jgi:hypothetical protein
VPHAVQQRVDAARGDGELSFLERPPGHALNMRFIDYDLDGDKKLSRTEFDRFKMAAGYDDEEQ